MKHSFLVGFLFFIMILINEIYFIIINYTLGVFLCMVTYGVFCLGYYSRVWEEKEKGEQNKR
jgi:hypothetical protein